MMLRVFVFALILLPVTDNGTYFLSLAADTETFRCGGRRG